MKLCRYLLTYLVATALVILPAARVVSAQENLSRHGNRPPVTASQPKMLATGEEPIPAEKKPGIGKYVLAGVLGAALIALAAGGAGGGGSDGGGPSTGDTGAVEVGW